MIVFDVPIPPFPLAVSDDPMRSHPHASVFIAVLISNTGVQIITNRGFRSLKNVIPKIHMLPVPSIIPLHSITASTLFPLMTTSLIRILLTTAAGFSTMLFSRLV